MKNKKKLILKFLEKSLIKKTREYKRNNFQIDYSNNDMIPNIGNNIIILLMCLCICLGCADLAGKNPPVVRKGIIDLGQWDLDKDGPVRLNGDWEFYWNELLNPEEYLSGKHGKKNFFKVPDLWNQIGRKSKSANNERFGPTGFVTYVLKIKGLHPGSKTDLAFSVEKIFSACSLYFIPLNDGSKNSGIKPLAKIGIVGRTKDQSVPHLLSMIKRIPEYSRSNIFLMQVSNHRLFIGGLARDIYLGTESDLRAIAMRHGHISFLVIGILLIMSAYHMMLFLLSRSDKSNLLFSLVCFFCSLWFALYDNLVHEYFVQPSAFRFIFFENITTFSYFIVLPLFASFLYQLFIEKVPSFIIPSIWIITISVFVLRIIFYIDSYPLFFGFNLFIVVCALVGLFFLIRGVLRGREYMVVSMIGYMIFITAVSNDVFKTHGFLNTPTLAPFGLVCFIIAHSFILSKKYTVEARRGRNSGYMKSYLTGVDIEDMKRMVENLMEEKKIYRDDSLTIQSLASELSLNRHQLSELINIKMNTNFKNLVNGYRIEEAKKLLLEEADRSVISIAYDVGFNSSTSFHRSFKNMTGQTPKEYRESGTDESGLD